MLNLVTARARTRGKSPVEFTFQAVGRLSPRFVTDKDGNPVLVDNEGKSVKYALKKVKDKDGKETDKTELPFELDSEKNPIAPEGTRFVIVDDVETSGLTDSMQEVLDLAGSLTDDERGYITVNETVKDAEGKETITAKKVARTPLQCVIDWSLDGFNYLSRKNAAPVSETVTEDELTPITAALVHFNILDEQAATTWRRTVTGTAKLMEMTRMDFTKTTPQYKKLLKAGYVPAVEAA